MPCFKWIMAMPSRKCWCLDTNLPKNNSFTFSHDFSTHPHALLFSTKYHSKAILSKRVGKVLTLLVPLMFVASNYTSTSSKNFLMGLFTFTSLHFFRAGILGKVPLTPSLASTQFLLSLSTSSFIIWRKSVSNTVTLDSSSFEIWQVFASSSLEELPFLPFDGSFSSLGFHLSVL